MGAPHQEPRRLQRRSKALRRRIRRAMRKSRLSSTAPSPCIPMQADGTGAHESAGGGADSVRCRRWSSWGWSRWGCGELAAGGVGVRTDSAPDGTVTETPVDRDRTVAEQVTAGGSVLQRPEGEPVAALRICGWATSWSGGPRFVRRIRGAGAVLGAGGLYPATAWRWAEMVELDVPKEVRDSYGVRN